VCACAPRTALRNQSSHTNNHSLTHTVILSLGLVGFHQSLTRFIVHTHTCRRGERPFRWRGALRVGALVLAVAGLAALVARHGARGTTAEAAGAALRALVLAVAGLAALVARHRARRAAAEAAGIAAEAAGVAAEATAAARRRVRALARHVARAAAVVARLLLRALRLLARAVARLAARRLVVEALLAVEVLLRNREGEVRPALAANQRLVGHLVQGVCRLGFCV